AARVTHTRSSLGQLGRTRKSRQPSQESSTVVGESSTVVQEPSTVVNFECYAHYDESHRLEASKDYLKDE
ncbi:MAG: hypothetical protein V3T64_13765, partial [Myxococcota bacterium]